MGVTARGIIRAARKNKLEIQQGNYNYCILGTMAKLKDMPTPNSIISDSVDAVGAAYGLTPHQTRSLEFGFEGGSRGWIVNGKPNKTYFKVGQNIAKALGFSTNIW